MRARTLPVLVAVALMGCAAEAPRIKSEASPAQTLFEQQYPGGVLCNNTYCSLAVTVGAGCAITVSPPILGVASDVEDAVLHWTLSSAGGAAFTEKGIDPKEGGAWNREFRNGTRVSATEFTWVDKNKLAGAPKSRPYGYNVEVTQDGKTCRIDPTIINDY
jgi:hypothetical protein